jgi:hypothetical protein
MINPKFNNNIDKDLSMNFFCLCFSGDLDLKHSAINYFFPKSDFISKIHFQEVFKFLQLLNDGYLLNQRETSPSEISLELLKAILNKDINYFCSTITILYRKKFPHSCMNQMILSSLLSTLTKGSNYEEFAKFSGLSVLTIESILEIIKLLQTLKLNNKSSNSIYFKQELLNSWSKKLNIQPAELALFLKILTGNLNFCDLNDFFITFQIDKIVKREIFFCLLSLIFFPPHDSTYQTKKNFLESRNSLFKVIKQFDLILNFHIN